MQLRVFVEDRWIEGMNVIFWCPVSSCINIIGFFLVLTDWTVAISELGKASAARKSEWHPLSQWAWYCETSKLSSSTIGQVPNKWGLWKAMAGKVFSWVFCLVEQAFSLIRHWMNLMMKCRVPADFYSGASFPPFLSSCSPLSCSVVTFLTNLL